MLILTVPLVDQLLQMNLYKVHNLPMLQSYPEFLHVQYELDGNLLSDNDGEHVHILTNSSWMLSYVWSQMDTYACLIKHYIQ